VSWMQTDDIAPALAVALAVKAGAPIYIRREIYDETLCRVVSLAGEDNNLANMKTGMRVDPSQPAQWRLPQNPRQLIQRAEDGLKRMQIQEQVSKNVWEMKAADILTFEKEQLRYLLREYSVPTTRHQSKLDMIDKVLPLLDEMQRRVILIRRAVEEEDYGTAATLAAGTSRRGRLSQQLVEAVSEERYRDAAEIQVEIEAETMGRADITQEPGSYDTFLDADDWYIKDLMKSKNRGHQQ